MQLCSACKVSDPNTYQVLLILTDGEIHDMDLTIDLITNAAALPLSIIIVGVGSADFTNMEKLDGDSGLVSSQGVKCPRDIVQFVPFRNVSGNSVMLAQELLRELPNQVVQYMKLMGRPPNQPVAVDINKMIAPKILSPELFGKVL